MASQCKLYGQREGFESSTTSMVFVYVLWPIVLIFLVFWFMTWLID
jgi:hypothetical protein